MSSHSLDVLARIRPTVPPGVVTKVEAWDPSVVPAVPRLSASVVLVRPRAPGNGGAAGVEVYLLHRHARMAFAASMVVFPGGGLDPVDEQAVDPVRACAVRETSEETGVTLRSDELRDWAHWVTPEVEPRRYDTRFYLALQPPGQDAADVSGETDSAGWAVPPVALAAAERGEIALMPPTLSILTELAEAGTVDALFAQAVDRVVEAVRPRIVRMGNEWRFAYPAAHVSGAAG